MPAVIRQSNLGLLAKSDPQPKWRNWQTRYVQGVVREPSCGFDSHLRHCFNQKAAFV